MSAESLQEALVDATRVIVSLDAIQDGGDEDQEASLYETLADDSQPDPVATLEANDLQERLVEALQGMGEREQLVLSLYYYEELTFKEIGAVLGVTESRVCQIHAQAVLNLRAYLNPAAQPEKGDSRRPKR
jgi:RNA polymerase sigma factor for flagellar operon FliA